ncbi:MAG: polysaccharide biosynthesis protein [Pseudomonadota bacterium]
MAQLEPWGIPAFNGLRWPVADALAEDLLGRPVASECPPQVRDAFRGKTVLVTGAGGSIGSVVCRRLVECEAKRIVLYDRSEFALYQLDSVMRATGAVAVPELGCIRDRQRLRRVMERHGVGHVVHAAAYKHVPMLEANPAEAVMNNVIGTSRVLEAAVEHGADVVLVSTDKAVAPAGIMGATKRWAEHVAAEAGQRSRGIRVGIVRFGNVLGSSGSVVPLFAEQIANGGPVTITDFRAERHFMTPMEAADLVLAAGAFGAKGEVFVRDSGPQVRIRDVAARMIRMAGKVPHADPGPFSIALHETQLRPGEKLREADFDLSDAQSTGLPGVYQLSAPKQTEHLRQALPRLFKAAEAENFDAIRSLLLASQEERLGAVA